MLGLGLGVNKSTATPKLILLDLDFETPATDFFNSYSVVGGDLTFTADQSAPGVQGANFLKIQYPNANQNAVGSEISGVRNADSIILDSAVNTSFLIGELHLMSSLRQTQTGLQGKQRRCTDSHPVLK